MVRSRVIVCIALVGCGRIGFEQTEPQLSDASSDAGDVLASRCGSQAGELFCEDFEGEPKLTTVETTAPGFARIDELKAARGRRSLHAVAIGSNVPAWMLGSALPDISTGELYARWYHYLPATVTNPQLAAVHIVDATTPFPGFIVGVTNGVMELVASKADNHVLSTVPAPYDRWMCVQLHVTISATAGRVEGWLDGEPFGVLTGLDTTPNVSFRNVHAGVFSTGFATEPQELWTDEIAIATQPISCD